MGTRRGGQVETRRRLQRRVCSQGAARGDVGTSGAGTEAWDRLFPELQQEPALLALDFGLQPQELREETRPLFQPPALWCHGSFRKPRSKTLPTIQLPRTTGRVGLARRGRKALAAATSRRVWGAGGCRPEGLGDMARVSHRAVTARRVQVRLRSLQRWPGRRAAGGDGAGRGWVLEPLTRPATATAHAAQGSR